MPTTKQRRVEILVTLGPIKHSGLIELVRCRVPAIQAGVSTLPCGCSLRTVEHQMFHILA